MPSWTKASRRLTPMSRLPCSRRQRRILLNEDIGVVPMNWYLGDYAYSDEIASFPQTNFGLVLWEQVAFAE